MGTGSFPGIKSSWGVRLTPHPLLMPRLGNSRAIPLLPLRALWPVQSLSACIRVHFTFFTFKSILQNFLLQRVKFSGSLAVIKSQSIYISYFSTFILLGCGKYITYSSRYVYVCVCVCVGASMCEVQNLQCFLMT